MKKVLVNRLPVEGPWGGGNLFVRSFYEEAASHGFKVVNYFDVKNKPDAIFMMSPCAGNVPFSYLDIERINSFFPHIPIICRVNDCDARKKTSDIDKLWKMLIQRCSMTIFVSNWMLQYYELMFPPAGSNDPLGKGRKTVVYNGVDSDVFSPKKKKQQKESNSIRIVAHHWSDNRMKGMADYEAIDAFVREHTGFEFTYIGRGANHLKNTRVVEPLFGYALGDELANHDVYYSGSMFDPGPNHILEALASGLPTYVTYKGGGSVEFAGVDHTVNSVNDFLAIVKERSFIKNENCLTIPTWKTCMSKVFDSINFVL